MRRHSIVYSWKINLHFDSFLENLIAILNPKGRRIWILKTRLYEGYTKANFKLALHVPSFGRINGIPPFKSRRREIRDSFEQRDGMPWRGLPESASLKRAGSLVN